MYVVITICVPPSSALLLLPPPLCRHHRHHPCRQLVFVAVVIVVIADVALLVVGAVAAVVVAATSRYSTHYPLVLLACVRLYRAKNDCSLQASALSIHSSNILIVLHSRTCLYVCLLVLSVPWRPVRMLLLLPSLSVVYPRC